MLHNIKVLIISLIIVFLYAGVALGSCVLLGWQGISNTSMQDNKINMEKGTENLPWYNGVEVEPKVLPYDPSNDIIEPKKLSNMDKNILDKQLMACTNIRVSN